MSGPARKPFCKRGHDMTLPNARNRYGACARCKQITGSAYYVKTRPKERENAHAKEAARVKTILDLVDQLDRAVTRFERDEIKAQIKALEQSYEI